MIANKDLQSWFSETSTFENIAFWHQLSNVPDARALVTCCVFPLQRKEPISGLPILVPKHISTRDITLEGNINATYIYKKDCVLGEGYLKKLPWWGGI